MLQPWESVSQSRVERMARGGQLSRTQLQAWLPRHSAPAHLPSNMALTPSMAPAKQNPSPEVPTLLSLSL